MTNYTNINQQSHFSATNLLRRKFSRLAYFASVSVLSLSALASHSVKAAPQGGQVVDGTATIANSGNTTTIDQSTKRAAIDWQSFDVAANETVNFKVPNNGATLNRVVNTVDASTINGTVQSNGTLYFINPNGMTFDFKSRVYAQNFVASTAVPDPSKFMKGGTVDFVDKQTFYRRDLIRLYGEIKVTNGGTVGAFGPRVNNSGSITAPSGNVMLAGVISHKNAVDENGKMTMVIDDMYSSYPVYIEAGNHGTIVADGGTISLIAKGVSNGVRHSPQVQAYNMGKLQARSVGSQTGSIEILAGNKVGGEGYSTISGTLDTSAADSTAKAGTITIDAGLGEIDIRENYGRFDIDRTFINQDTNEFKASSTKISARYGVYFLGTTNVSGGLSINSNSNVSVTAKLTADSLTINQDRKKDVNFVRMQPSGNTVSLINLSDVVVTGDILINQNLNFHSDVSWQDSSTLVGIDIGTMSSLNGNITLNQAGSLSVAGRTGFINRAVYGIRAVSLAAKNNVVMNQRQFVNASTRVDANGNSNEHNILVSSVTAGKRIEYNVGERNVGSSLDRYRQTNLVYKAIDGSTEATVKSPDDYTIEVDDIGRRSFEIIVDTVHSVDNGYWRATPIEYSKSIFGQSTSRSFDFGAGGINPWRYGVWEYGPYGYTELGYQINEPEWVPGVGAYRDLNVYITELRPVVSPVAPVTPSAGTPLTPLTPVTPSAGTPPTLSTPVTPSAGTPSAGTPSAGTPSAGTPSAGTPSAGSPATPVTPVTPTAGSPATPVTPVTPTAGSPATPVTPVVPPLAVAPTPVTPSAGTPLSPSTPVAPPVVSEPAPTVVVTSVAVAPTPAVTPIADSPATPVTPITNSTATPVTPVTPPAATPLTPPTSVAPPAAIVPTVVATVAPVPPTVVTPAPVQKPSYSVSYIIDNPNYGQTRAGTVLDWTTAGITSIVTKTVNGVSTSVTYKGVSVQLSHNAVDYGTILYKAPYALYYTQKTGALWTPVITSDGNLIQKTDLVVPTKK